MADTEEERQKEEAKARKEALLKEAARVGVDGLTARNGEDTIQKAIDEAIAKDPSLAPAPAKTAEEIEAEYAAANKGEVVAPAPAAPVASVGEQAAGVDAARAAADAAGVTTADMVKVSEREALINKLDALGIDKSEIPEDVDEQELQAMLKRVEDLRRKWAEKNQKEKLGDAYGKFVSARVLKKGDGKIATGMHIRGMGDVHYEFGDIIEINPRTAEKLEELGYIEIQPED